MAIFTSRVVIFSLAFFIVVATTFPVRRTTNSTDTQLIVNPPLDVVEDASLSEKITAESTAGGGLQDKLFPVPGFSKSWTTSPGLKNALALSDAAFRPTNVIKNLPHTYTTAPDGKKAMKAHYPKGSYNFGHKPQGGFSFYAPGPASVDLSTAKEATFGYSVFFPKGFEFQLGGKLPGLCKFFMDNFPHHSCQTNISQRWRRQ